MKAAEEDHLQREITRAREADALLKNPLLVGAFDALRGAHLRAWEESPARDIEGRERLWLAVSVLNKVQADLRSIVTTGKLARESLAREQTRLQRLASRVAGR